MSESERGLRIDPATREWLKSSEYLPPVMRDFHDQKDVFKSIFFHCRYAGKPSLLGDGVGWIDAHIFTVDFFLWYMAAHGYTLQRSRKRVPFLDLNATDKVRRDWEVEQLRAELDDCPVVRRAAQ